MVTREVITFDSVIERLLEVSTEITKSMLEDSVLYKILDEVTPINKVESLDVILELEEVI